MKLTPRQQQLIQRTFLDYQSTADFLECPLVIERAEGLRLWDTAGREYLDAIGGIFVAGLGHRHPRVMEAMRRQMERATFVPPLHGISDVTLEFIDKLGSIAPGDLRYAKPVSGGSEAVETALKFTRQYFQQSGRPGKYKFVSVYLGYHGATFGAMGASGTGRRKTRFEPQMPGFLKVLPPIALRDRFSSWDETCRFAARLFEDVIVNEDPATVAGILVEPISNTAGIQTPTSEYFRILREICDRHQVLLIFDEVITGFGRTGKMFAAQTFGVTPDILCAGKGISSGAVPMGAMLAREDLGEAFAGPAGSEVNFAHGHTFAGNPLAAAVGIAVIDEIVEKRLDARAAELGEYLVGRLERLRALGCIREIRGKGLLRGVEFAEDPAAGRPFPADRKLGKILKRVALEQGLILRVDPDWFAVAPPLIATEAEIDEIVDRIEQCLTLSLERMHAPAQRSET